MSQKKFNIKKMLVADIDQAFYNPRKVLKKGSKKYENIKKSIEEFGLIEPLIVNEVNNRLVSGHQRLNVIKDLGWTEVECNIVHIEDEIEEKALNVALNKIEGKWDKDKLAEVISDIDGFYDALELGFEESDIAKFLAQEEEDKEEGGYGEEEARKMDDKISLKTDAASSIVAIVGIRFPIPAEEFSAMETELIEKGYFTDKEIGEALLRRFLCEI